MDTTAFVLAAGDSSASGWFEGWIGGLIAASVTISATVWYDARTRRRSALDVAVADMIAAADEVWMSLRTLPPRTPPSDLLFQLGRSRTIVQAHAERRGCSRERRGFAATVATLNGDLKPLSEPLEWFDVDSGDLEGWTAVAQPVILAAMGYSAAGTIWIREPRRYAREGDISASLRFGVESPPPPATRAV